MSDLFHEQVPISFLLEVFRVMCETPQHTYQILTKRHRHLLELEPLIDWPENVWMGVSVESQEYAHRIDFLCRTGTRVKFVSCEPLLGPFELDLRSIDWVIVGGESGPDHRPIDPAWVRSIRDQCQRAGIPFFFSNGVAERRRAGAGPWTAVPGTSFPRSAHGGERQGLCLWPFGRWGWER